MIQYVRFGKPSVMTQFYTCMALWCMMPSYNLNHSDLWWHVRLSLNLLLDTRPLILSSDGLQVPDAMWMLSPCPDVLLSFSECPPSVPYCHHVCQALLPPSSPLIGRARSRVHNTVLLLVEGSQALRSRTLVLWIHIWVIRRNYFLQRKRLAQKTLWVVSGYCFACISQNTLHNVGKIQFCIRKGTWGPLCCANVRMIIAHWNYFWVKLQKSSLSS